MSNSSIDKSYVTDEWLEIRQAEYDRRMKAYGAEMLEPTSSEMWATHQEVVWEIDCLPIAQGGRSGAMITESKK